MQLMNSWNPMRRWLYASAALPSQEDLSMPYNFTDTSSQTCVSMDSTSTTTDISSKSHMWNHLHLLWVYQKFHFWFLFKASYRHLCILYQPWNKYIYKRPQFFTFKREINAWGTSSNWLVVFLNRQLLLSNLNIIRLHASIHLIESIKRR